MPKKLSYDEVKNFIETESECKLLSTEYINYDSPLIVKCKCGNEFNVTFDKFKIQNKRQCNECGAENRRIKSLIPYSIVKQYIEIDSKSNCKLLTEEKDYTMSENNILLKCSCGNIFTSTFHRFKSKKQYMCSTCSKLTYNKKRKSNTKFLSEVYEKCGQEYIVLDKYLNNNIKVTLQHNCGYIYEVTPANFLFGERCPKCSKRVKNKTTDYFKQEIHELVGDEYCVLGEYDNAKEKILMKHNKCEYIWEISPDAFLNGNSRCPKCTGYKNENKVLDFLINNNINYNRQYKIKDCKDKKPLPFDFAIFNEDNCLLYLVETDGRQHYEPVNFGGISNERALENFKITQYHDQIKNQYCKDNNIKLIRIPYWDFDIIERILEKEILSVI